MALVIFEDGKMPKAYWIPATAWQQSNELLRDRPYTEMKCKPEWGLNIAKKHMHILEQYAFDKMLMSFE